MSLREVKRVNLEFLKYGFWYLFVVVIVFGATQS